MSVMSYWTVGALIGWMAWIIRRLWPAAIAAEHSVSLGPYQTAYLAGGAKRVEQTVLARLLQADLVTLWRLYLNVDEPVNDAKVASLSEEIELDAWACARIGSRGHEFHNALRDSVASLVGGLRAQGLLHGPERGRWVHAATIGPLVVWMLFGIATLKERLPSDGGFAFLGLGVGALFCLYLAFLPLRTPASWTQLGKLRKRHRRGARRRTQGGAWLLAIALHGLPATSPIRRFVNAPDPVLNQRASHIGCGGCGGCGGD